MNPANEPPIVSKVGWEDLSELVKLGSEAVVAVVDCELDVVDEDVILVEERVEFGLDCNWDDVDCNVELT
jgi:hypothetical protein